MHQDTETGLYYLMSRYYDPITHRFINADGYFQSGTSILDANTFAYCGNNPVLNVDPLGTCKVPNYTSAGTYIGHTWKIKESVPGVPGFCNVCKGYGSNAPSNTSHSFVISSYTTPSTKKQDYNTWNKVADSFGAIFCSLEVDFDAGFGFGFDVTDIFSIKAMGKHTLISVHFARQIVWKFLQVCAVGTCLEYRILNSMKMDLAMSMRILVHLIKLAFQREIMLVLVRL